MSRTVDQLHLESAQHLPKYAAIGHATAGNNTLVAAVTGKKIRLLAFYANAAGGANTIRLESDADGSALTGRFDLASDANLVLPYNPLGWCETVAGELLNMELSDATLVSGFLTYEEI